MMGHARELVFAVIKPIHVLDWGPTWVWRAEEGEPSNCPGLILDMQCRANVKLLKLLLADRNVLKVGLVFANRWEQFGVFPPTHWCNKIDFIFFGRVQKLESHAFR